MAPSDPVRNPLATSAVTPDGVIPGYLATPVQGGPWPGVVVIHELFGLNDDIRRIADRFAAAGYLAFAPDLMSMGNRVACIVSMMRSLAAGKGRDIDRLLAARAWLAEQPGCTGRVGVAGFCLGGGFALVLANQGFDVASISYGRLPRNLTAALAGSCPMVASYGSLDASLRGAAAKLEAGLEEAGVTHDVKEYPQAGHSFMNDHGGSGSGPLAQLTKGMHVGYVELAAEDAWDRVLAMFEATLGAAN